MNPLHLQIATWIAGILSCLIALIVNRRHLKDFLQKWGKLFIAVFLVGIVLEGWLHGWFSWLDHPVTWPVWALILLGISCLAIPWGIIFIITYFEKQPQQSQQPNPYNYTSDIIFGIEWLWGYVGGKLNERELSAFCPNQNCKCRLEPQINENARNFFNIGLEPPVALICGNCSFRREYDFGMEDLKRKVFIEVERRIRTGEFRQRLVQNEVR